MSALADLIRRMSEAGAPPEAIAIAVEAIEGARANDAERRARQAERKARSRALSRDSHGTVTGQSVTGHGTVPPDGPPPLPAPSPPPLNPPQSSSLRSSERASAPTATAKAASRAHRLPEDWTPGEIGYAYARSLGASQAEAEREFEKFRNYWLGKSGASATKTDWLATWRNWCLTAQERGTFRGGTGPPQQQRNGFGQPSVDMEKVRRRTAEKQAQYLADQAAGKSH